MRALDVDGVRVHVPVRQACSFCVFVSAALLEAHGDCCDASGAKAGFLPGRCCAASLCSILCRCQDIIPRTCQALYFRVICPTAVRGEPLWVRLKMQKDGFPGRDSWKVTALGRPFL